ncbi:hypothetical protein ARMGADRAFT_1101013, partial [Armillaria gallica]
MFSGQNGLQSHLDVYSPWASRKGLLVNIAKTKAMAFGKLPDMLPIFTILGRLIEWTNKHKYLGVTFISSHADIFSQHYIEKEKSACHTANVTFTLVNYFGDLPPRERVSIYKSCIDPLLSFGVEVTVDVSASHSQILENVQVTYLRHLLSIQKRSIRAIMFTETGILPLPYRHILFVLCYLAHVLCLQEHRILTWCLESNVDLWVQGKACWLGDIAILSLESLLNPEDVNKLIKAVPQRCSDWAQNQIQSSAHLELMWDRVKCLRGGRLSSEPLLFRSYLLVCIWDHRVALTRLLMVSHTLAVEQGRWMTVRNSSVHVPRAFRLCRMCHDDVEDEIHILFTCS